MGQNHAGEETRSADHRLVGHRERSLMDRRIGYDAGHRAPDRRPAAVIRRTEQRARRPMARGVLPACGKVLPGFPLPPVPSVLQQRVPPVQLDRQRGGRIAVLDDESAPGKTVAPRRNEIVGCRQGARRPGLLQSARHGGGEVPVRKGKRGLGQPETVPQDRQRGPAVGFEMSPAVRGNRRACGYGCQVPRFRWRASRRTRRWIRTGQASRDRSLASRRIDGETTRGGWCPGMR